MAGEIWREQVQWGVEVTAGTAVAATRIMYFEQFRLAPALDPRVHEFDTGTRDAVRSVTKGPLTLAGSGSQPLSADEIIEPLLITVKGAVTPTTPSAGVYLWTFTPTSALPDAATMEWDNGAQAVRGAGMRGNSLTISGSVNAPNMVNLDLFGIAFDVNALTGSLAARTPTILEGWETALYLESGLGGTPGTTLISNTLINWNIPFSNNLARKFYANNQNRTSAVTIGRMGLSGSVTFEAAASQSATEMTNWLANSSTPRLLRFEFGQNTTIASTYKKFVKVDVPCYITTIDLGGNDNGTRTYAMNFQYVYDSTNAFGVRFQVQNGRSAAW